ncbi:isoamyl alcohol [Botrytis cinerea]
MLSSHLSHITALALSLPTLILATCNSTQTCKITPADASWPSSADWTAFNTSISGTLIKTLPPASSCYTGNPFNSTQNCSSVQTNWNLATWQAETPEGIDYPIYANNSCLPTDATGYQDGKGCDIGGSPIYVVNATTEDHVSTAMKWATERNIRVVIKGSNSTADVLIAGSGNNLKLVYTAADEAGKTIVGGDAKNSHPAVSFVSVVKLEVTPLGSENDTTTASAAWNALAILFQNFPDLMDNGLAGQLTAATGYLAQAFSGSESTPPGVYFSQVFYGYNTSTSEMATLISPLIEKMGDISNGSLSINYTVTAVYDSYLDFFYGNNPGEEAAGQVSFLSTHLLGRTEMIVGLQGGPGPARVPENMRGSLNPVWRETYLHVITLGATVDTTLTAKKSLAQAAEWMQQNKEELWREWAPDMGAYINEGNPYNTEWKHDFFGISYDRLAEIKKKYDPTGSLYILAGVGSDEWDYDLDTGKLCRV